MSKLAINLGGLDEEEFTDILQGCKLLIRTYDVRGR